MAYPKSVREQALVHYQNGLNDDEVSKRTGISKYTLGTWKKLLFDTGSLEKKKVERKSGKPYKYTPEKIKEMLEKSKSPVVTKSPKGNKTQGNPILFSQPKIKKKKKKI